MKGPIVTGRRCGFVFIFGVVVLLSGLSSVGVAQPGSSGDPSVIPPDLEVEELFDGGCTLTEGVAVGHDGMVYFSDITFTFLCRDEKGVMEAGHIWKYNPQTDETAIFRSPSGMSNGIKFDADGNMIVAEGADYGGRKVVRTDVETGESYIIAGLYEGRPFNAPNDITIDEKGRIYFSDPKYLGHEPMDQPVMGVYRIDLDGSVERIITDMAKPNGVCVSPDQKTLYVIGSDNGAIGFDRLPEGSKTQTGHRSLRAYDLDANGDVTFREELVVFIDGPDGLVADVEGNLYVAYMHKEHPGIYVYSPQGEELGHIPTPEPPTNAGFARGEDSKVLYITAGASLYRTTVMIDGYHIDE